MSIIAMRQALDAMEYIHSPMTEEEDKRIAHAVMGLIDAIDQAEARVQPQQTHSEECWRWHHACAIARIEERQWVGLTPEEVKEISLANRPYVIDMVRALEQRLKEKNT